ncbi:hypothetical protein [Erythrobacter oryzae]|uniref:hypothetical protein n=1 Tax=Erythrobacter oryzae TaxID=3019556 RepID=UPI002552F942|nr:hypothetical protein [Erythrobacter sp. COR-2]
MPDADDRAIPGHPAGPPPEAHNDEQDAAGTQAQDVAEDARREDSRTASPLESTKPAANDVDPAPDSTGDLIDEMRRMEGEGRIDMSAFAGEPNHDDEPGTYGGETTDDADGDWLTADGETLSEDDAETLLDAESYEELERALDSDAKDGADEEE